jgi:hypothetical protein
MRLKVLVWIVIALLSFEPTTGFAQSDDGFGQISDGGTSDGRTGDDRTGDDETYDPTIDGQDPTTPGKDPNPPTAHNEPRQSEGRDTPFVPRPTTIVRTSGGRPEFIFISPPGQANDTVRALQQVGAVFLRARTLGALSRRVMIFDLRGTSLGQARAILATAAPLVRSDVHTLYRLSKGPRLYAAKMIGAPASQGCRIGAMRIGTIDGPVDLSHPALRDSKVTAHSVLGKNDKTADTNHGTAVAALLVGQDPNGALSGFALGAELFAVSAFGKNRRGAAADLDRIAAALDWLLSRNVRLINMSFAGPSNEAFDDLLAAAAGRGAIMIAAAGNDGSDEAAYPAAAASVIAVTAVDARGRHYRAANTGAHIEFAAPGVDLYVADKRGGGYASGTSYAAPIITALSARMILQGAGSATALRAGLQKRSVDLGDPGRDSLYGWGLVTSPGCE